MLRLKSCLRSGLLERAQDQDLQAPCGPNMRPLRLQVNVVNLCSGRIVRQLQGQGLVQAAHLLDNDTCLHVQLHRASLHYVHSGQLIRRFQWQGAASGSAVYDGVFCVQVSGDVSS